MLALLIFTISAQATDLTSPLPVRNLYPPTMRFFDPTPDSALRTFDQTWLLELTQHYSTVNIIDLQPGVRLLVDMELYVLEPTLRYSVGNSLVFSVSVPLMMPASGVFDGAIKSFHDGFGFPDNGRGLRPNNSFAYRFDNGKGTRWQGRSQFEFGNVELSSHYQLLRGEHWGMAALAAIKLPTASKARGWGSGAPDLAVGVVVSWRQERAFAHLEGWAIQPLASDEPGIHYERYMRGSVSLGYQLFDAAALIVQVQGGNSPYQSTIAALDHPPFLVSFGLRGELGSDEDGDSGPGWTAMIVENISQVTAQDLSVAIGLTWPIE